MSDSPAECSLMLAPDRSPGELAKLGWDVIVIGAGPAGAVAARALAQNGRSTLLLDRASFPRKKICGCCLNPSTLRILQSSGLHSAVRRQMPQSLEYMHLASGVSRAAIRLSGWQALSRERLDMALIEESVAAGTQFLPEAQASLGMERENRRFVVVRNRSECAEIGGKVILVANGLSGRSLPPEAGSVAQVAVGSRLGAGVILDNGPDFYEPRVVYMAYGNGGYVGLVRLEDGRLNIAAALEVLDVRTWQNPGKVVSLLLREMRWPAIPGLEEANWHGTPPLTRSVSRPAGSRVFTIGDAGGYIEPFTGEGIGWAMASALSVLPFVLAAVAQWKPELADAWISSERKRRQSSGSLCRAVTWFSRHSWLAGNLIRLVGRAPWLATPVISRIGI